MRWYRPNSSIEIEVFPFHSSDFARTLKNMRRQLKRSIGRYKIATPSLLNNYVGWLAGQTCSAPNGVTDVGMES